MLITISSLLFLACERTSEESAIIEYLENSEYANEASMFIDDTASTPYTKEFTDSILPWVRWVRRINRPVERKYQVEINGDSALVTITSYLVGTPPQNGFIVCNQPGSGIYFRRLITDSTRRQVKLVRIRPRVWRLVSFTPCEIKTVNGYTPIAISEVKLEVPQRNYEYRITDPYRFIPRDSLADFRPSDTIKVTVKINIESDSGWVFLHKHRRRINRPHFRMPLFKRDQTTFVGTWIIPEEIQVPTPVLAHCAFDVIGFNTLFGDSSATYAARAWMFPYIIRNPQDEIPE
jgi:hypothetical protein